MALTGYAAGGWTADTMIVTETETATAPPVTRTVVVTRTVRAARDTTRTQVSRSADSDNSGRSEYHNYARGLVSPLMDQQFDNDATLMEIILDAEKAEPDRRRADETG